MAGELIDEYGEDIESIMLIRGAGGNFDVTVDGRLIFSKKQEKRHPNAGEIIEKIVG